MSTLRYRLRVVSNFGDRDCGAGEIQILERQKLAFLALPSRHVSSKFRARARVYFARPTIAIAKIRDYSQSNFEKTSIKLLKSNQFIRSWT